VVTNVARVFPGVIYSGVYTFLATLPAVTILLFFFPGTVTFLPDYYPK
jgi:hypothetical protein